MTQNFQKAVSIHSGEHEPTAAEQSLDTVILLRNTQRESEQQSVKFLFSTYHLL